MKKKQKNILEKKIIKWGSIFSLLLIIGCVFSGATLSKTNVEVERLKVEVKNQQNINQSMVMKINELSSLDNIKNVIQDMGLAFNNNNIKSIK